MSVPILSIIFICISMILSIGVPIGLFLFSRKKYRLSIVPLLVGAAAFVLFVFVLESIMHQIILKPDASGNIASRPLLFMLYGGFAAGVFEETARFISFNLLKKRYYGFGTALSYGIGHGGIESILLAGIAMINNLILSLTINSGSTNVVSEQITTALTTTDPLMFLISGGERIMAITIQIALSILVWYAVARKDKRWLYPIAILLHAIIDFPAVLLQTSMIQNIYLVEGLVFVCTLIIIYIAMYTHKKLKPNDENAI